MYAVAKTRSQINSRSKEMTNKSLRRSLLARVTVVLLVLVISCATASGHNVKGLDYPTLATARITSPTSAVDMPVAIYDTGVSVACFKVRNTSPYDAVISAIGIELPGDYGDFSLVLPTDSTFHLGNSVTLSPYFPERTLDFAFLTGPRFNSNGGKGGLTPSTQFTTMCASGQFPSGMTIEEMLNYVFVRFSRVGPKGTLDDIGIWENAPIP
jgi:hypothetical protein